MSDAERASELANVPWQLWVVGGFFLLAFLAQPIVYAWCDYTLRKVQQREAEREAAERAEAERANGASHG